ncbi:MAG: hypothetical protein ACON4N_04910 [Myxococcota bacterium]
MRHVAWGLVLTAGCTAPTSSSPSTPFDTAEAESSDCILLNGEGGYGHIQEAADAAMDGDIIQICEGVVRGGITLRDKAVTLRGAGPDLTALDGVDDITLDVVGGSVHLEGLRLRSHRAVLRLDSTQAQLIDVTIDGAGAQGLWSVYSDVRLERTSVLGAEAGAVRFAGGSVQWDTGEIASSSHYGLRLDGAVTGTLTGLSIHDITPAGDLPEQAGWGLRTLIRGTSVHLTDLTMTGLERGMFLTEGTSTTLERVSIEAAQPLHVELADLEATDLSLSGATDVGLYADASSLRVASLTVDGGEVGVYAEGTDVELTSGTIQNQGVVGVELVGPSPAPAVLQDVAVSSVTGVGMSLDTMVAELHEVDVADISQPDSCLTTGQQSCGFALQLLDSELSVSHVAIADSRWGLVSTSSEIELLEGTLPSLHITQTDEAAVQLVGGSLTGKDLEIDAHGRVGLALYADATATLTTPRFAGGSWTSQVTMPHADGTLTTEVLHQSRDIYGLHASLTLDGPIHEDGDTVLHLDQGVLVVDDGTFTSYRTGGIVLNDSTASIRQSLMQELGGVNLRYTNSTVQLEGVHLEAPAAAQVGTTTSMDGAILSEQHYALPRPALWGTDSILHAVGFTAEDVSGMLMQQNGGQASLTDTVATNIAGNPALDFSTAEITIGGDSALVNTSMTALGVHNANLTIDGLLLDQVGLHGVVSTSSDVTITQLTTDGVGGTDIIAAGSLVDLGGWTGSTPTVSCDADTVVLNCTSTPNFACACTQ